MVELEKKQTNKNQEKKKIKDNGKPTWGGLLVPYSAYDVALALPFLLPEDTEQRGTCVNPLS